MGIVGGSDLPKQEEQLGEGIALRVDPSYSIVAECFPYLARRLLTDDHPRAASLSDSSHS